MSLHIKLEYKKCMCVFIGPLKYVHVLVWCGDYTPATGPLRLIPLQNCFLLTFSNLMGLTVILHPTLQQLHPQKRRDFTRLHYAWNGWMFLTLQLLCKNVNGLSGLCCSLFTERPNLSYTHWFSLSSECTMRNCLIRCQIGLTGWQINTLTWLHSFVAN